MSVVLVAVSCGTIAANDQHEEMVAKAAITLGASDDPDALAVAALLNASAASALALEQIERATDALPDDPDLAWIQAAICAEVKGCDPVRFEARFRSLDPDNAFGWIAAIDRAHAAADEVGLATSLAQAATLPVVNARYTTSIARFTDVVINAGQIPLDDAFSAVISAFIGVMPRLSGVIRACDTDALRAPARLAACRAIARSLMSSDTAIHEMVGIAIAVRAWPADSDERKLAHEAQRVYAYRSGVLSCRQDDEDAQRLLPLMAEYPREQDLLAAQLIAHGIDPTPPGDWEDVAHGCLMRSTGGES